MQIRNNWGELIGEINSGVTDKGERIITNTIYYNGNPVVQNISVHDDQGKVRTTTVFGSKILPLRIGCTGATLDSLLERTGVGPNEVQGCGSHEKHNCGEAVWNVNLRAARQRTCHRDQLMSGEVFEVAELQQGTAQLALDWRQNRDVSHTCKLRSD
jgi:hypothetical protein